MSDLINIENIFPPHLLDDALYVKVNDKIKSYYNYYNARIAELDMVYLAEETAFFRELADLVAAYVVSGDDEFVVRSKAAGAIALHRSYAIFKEIWKITIDSILGGDSSIIHEPLFYGSFVVGASVIGSPAKLGPVSFSEGEIESPSVGAVFINIDVTPTTEQLNQILLQLRPLVPIYLNVYLGTTQIVDSDTFVVGVSEIGGDDVIGVDPDPVQQFVFTVKI